MNNKMKKSIEKLTGMDSYMNEDIRNVYIDNIVSNLKRGVYPKISLERVEQLIKKHNRIVNIKKNLKSRG